MDVYAINLEEALAQRTSSDLASSIASYHHKELTALHKELRNLVNQDKTAKSRIRFSEINSLIARKEFLVKHFTHLAKELRRIGAR